MPSPKSFTRSELRDMLKAKAACVLAYAKFKIGRPIRVAARNRRYRITIAVSPVGVPEDTQHVALPGSHFSPFEKIIFERVRDAKAAEPGRIILGKNIASMVGHEYDPAIKVIIRNLVDRQVLSHDDSTGYTIAKLPKPTV